MSPLKKSRHETSRVARVSKNAAVLLGAKVVTSGLSFFLVIAINRELGPLRAGIFAYAFAMYSIFMIVPDFGLGSISVRDVSQDHTKINYYFKNVVAIRLLLGLGAFLVLVATDFVGALIRSPLSFDQKFWTVLHSPGEDDDGGRRLHHNGDSQGCALPLYPLRLRGDQPSRR
jgi:O-antigen/teichoic acid export membrane protein